MMMEAVLWLLEVKSRVHVSKVDESRQRHRQT